MSRLRRAKSGSFGWREGGRQQQCSSAQEHTHRDLDVEAANALVELDGSGERHHARNVDVILDEVQMQELRVGQELGQRDGTLGRQVGVVEEEALELCVESKGHAEGRDLQRG